MIGEQQGAENPRSEVEQAAAMDYDAAETAGFDDVGPFSPESLRPRRISHEFYSTDDPGAHPSVSRAVVDGVVYETWSIPDFKQTPNPRARH